MGSCCVREKEEHPTTHNMPHNIQVIRMQRRELLINQQKPKSVHQLSQSNITKPTNPNEANSDFETNNSTNFSPHTKTQKNEEEAANNQDQQKQQDSPVNQNVDIQNELNEETEEMVFDGHDNNERTENNKCTFQSDHLLTNFQTIASKNQINSDSLIGEEQDQQNHLIENNENDIIEIQEVEEHEDSFSKQLTEQLRKSLMNDPQFQDNNDNNNNNNSNQNFHSYKISEIEFPSQSNDISNISSYTQRNTFPAKLSNQSKTMLFDNKSNYTTSRPSSQRNINLTQSGSSKNKSRQPSPINNDIINQKQEVFNFQKTDNLTKLQQDAFAKKEEQLKIELKKQETLKMDEEMKKLDKKKLMKQFNSGLIHGNSFFFKSQCNTPVNNFQATQGLGSVSSSTRSPTSSDHKTQPMRTNSTHFTQYSSSARQSMVGNSVMPNSINVPSSIFENFKVKSNNNYSDKEEEA